ncbi:MAG TPA: M28 family peptidase [Polyangiaceae bacterium]|nr:M28 family peptidase [Polyangiaceae bacterium]
MKLSNTAQRVLFYGGLASFLLGATWYATAMPGRSHRGPLPPAEQPQRATEAELSVHVTALAGAIGERSVGAGDSLTLAREYVRGELAKLSSTGPSSLTTEDVGPDGSNAHNVIFTLTGQSAEIVLVGAHYDSAPGTPGANDNASGVAVGLLLAKRLAPRRFERTLRFVFFANEEPPYFQNPGMGSLAHARASAQRGDRIVAMLALESLGHYSDAAHSQRYPWPVGLLYPDVGDFVAFVGNVGSRDLVHRAIATFRESAAFPSEGAALPGAIPGVGWSDHWSFWQYDYPAIMVTDTAVFRDRNYHQSGDLPPELDYGRMARVASGLENVVAGLAGLTRP